MSKSAILTEKFEKTGPDFRVEKVLAARDRALAAMAAIAHRIQPGMVENEAYEMAKSELANHGVERNWHRPYVRFGRNTLKMYGEPSEPAVRLGTDDIFFLDLGPVFDGYEGDCGDTYTVGNDADMIRAACAAREIFVRVRTEWRRGDSIGPSLYAFARQQAEALGWDLHLGVDGHRVSDFPHALYYKGGIGEADFALSPHLWVLEVQIRHPSRDFGAFYEDILF